MLVRYWSLQKAYHLCKQELSHNSWLPWSYRLPRQSQTYTYCPGRSMQICSHLLFHSILLRLYSPAPYQVLCHTSYRPCSISRNAASLEAVCSIASQNHQAPQCSSVRWVGRDRNFHLTLCDRVCRGHKLQERFHYRFPGQVIQALQAGLLVTPCRRLFESRTWDQAPACICLTIQFWAVILFLFRKDEIPADMDTGQLQE